MDRQIELARLGEASRNKHWEVTNTNLSYGPHRTRILESTKGHLAGTSEVNTLGSDPPTFLTSLLLLITQTNLRKPEKRHEIKPALVQPPAAKMRSAITSGAQMVSAR